MKEGSSHPIEIPKNGNNSSVGLESMTHGSFEFPTTFADISLLEKCTPDMDTCADGNQPFAFPIDLLPGENIELNDAFDGSQLVLTNFRLCVLPTNNQSLAVIPLMNIETLDYRDSCQLSVCCKEGRVYRLTALSSESAIDWHRRLTKCTTRSSSKEAFAWQFAAAIASGQTCSWLGPEESNEDNDFYQDFVRLGYDEDFFKISEANKGYTCCETYPERVVVPKEITDDDIKVAKEHRFLQRFPAIVWQNNITKAVLLRSSQPKVGIFSWRNSQDEKFFELIRKYQCTLPDTKSDDNPKGRQVIIMDARSYPAAWANRAKGGGFESSEYYQGTDILFLGLPNIHNIRYSFHQLRSLFASNSVDQPTYLASMQSTHWLLYLNNLLNAAVQCVDILDRGDSVLVHCSDGWDRTTQIVSFAKIMADDYYRTMKGFEELIRREWCAFGHKFSDRNGACGTDLNERAPVFLQFLDGVHQMILQRSTAFQFNHQYLIKLAQHAYAGLFEDFLYNSEKKLKEAREACEPDRRAISLWRYLHQNNLYFVNMLYDSEIKGRLDFNVGVEDLRVWKEVFCGLNVCGRNQTFIPESPTTVATALLNGTLQASREGTVVKSKSSDSLNSMIGNYMEGVSGMSPLTGSNGALNTSIEHDNNLPMNDSTPTSSKGRRSDVIVSRPTPIKSIKELVDEDGLAEYFDETQDRLRKKYRQSQLESNAREQRLAELARNRSFSGKTSHSHDSRLHSQCDDESDSLSHATSDFSLVEDVNCKPASGWSLSNDCFICHKQFSMIAIHTADRRHHCRFCYNVVCDACSQQQFQSAEEGRSTHRRACDKCYQDMQHPQSIREAISTDDEELETLSSSPLRKDNVVPSSPHVSPNGTTFQRTNCTSQAVKG